MDRNIGLNFVGHTCVTEKICLIVGKNLSINVKYGTDEFYFV